MSAPALPDLAVAQLDLAAEPVTRDPESWERELAARLHRQDPQALPELYERFGRHVFGFLHSALPDRASAEDVQQQVFLDAWRRSETYDVTRASPLTWLMMIARSRAIDHRRKRVPQPTEDLPDGREAADPSADIDALVEVWRVAGLLAQLPPEEAALLRMRFYDDLPQSEIARRTGIPLGTVKMRMANGLRTLRDLVEDEPA
jgi:RNA polymerase sigma-70 factor, ECF subfamily